MLSSLPFLLAALLAGCAIGDSEHVDCRCAPDTDTRLFPHCDGVVQERPDPKTPLSTQIPDCPSGPRLGLRERTAPASVLANLTSIFQAQPGSRSPQQYMEQFADDFVFIPDPEDVQLYPEVYDANRDTLWGAAEESNFARLILSERIHSATLSAGSNRRTSASSPTTNCARPSSSPTKPSSSRESARPRTTPWKRNSK